MNKFGLAVDKKALVQIYERHSPEIFRYACRILDNRELAEDCVADTFLRLLIAVRGGIVPENVRAYLFRIAHNWIMDNYRRQPPAQMSLEEDLHANPEENPSHLVAQELDRQRIRSALVQLTPEQRQVIELRFMENFSHLEVAAVLGKNVEATRALQTRAVEALRKILAVDENILIFQNAGGSTIAGNFRNGNL
jgi:RNA polymerase sigma-70 factor, ECF subfamily